MAVSLEKFAQGLVRSGLFSAAELAAFREALAPEKRPKNVQGLARELVRAGKLTKYQAGLVYQGKTKGLVLGEYVVLDEIGRGGMGQVLKARHRTMDRVVALKQLPPGAMRSPQAIERFRREVKAAARLEHPNIVTAHDAGEADGIHFLVMQYVEGKDLARVLAEQGPLGIEEAVDCAIQAARGLEYAHRQGIVHRDIKPANLLVDREGTVKILDMGLARMDEPRDPATPAATADRLTESGQVMGTCDYMAPEQAENTRAADHRADVYSLGCTLYRLLTGQRPYEGETPIQILLAHCQAPVPSPCRVRPDVPAGLDAVCQKMMAKRPEDRYQSMGEVIADLEACLRRETPPLGGAPAGDPSSGDRALKRFFQSMDERPAVAAPEAAVAVEETIAHRPEEETRGGVAGKAATDARRKTLILVSVAGAAAALVVISALMMTLGRGGADAMRGPPPQAVATSGLPEKRGRGSFSSDAEPETKAELEPAAWQAAWDETEAQAKALLAEQRFGEAEKLYAALDQRYDDLRLNRLIADATTGVREQAKAAYQAVEARARGLAGEKKFTEARSALEAFVKQHDVPANVEAANKLLSELDAAETQARAQAAAASAEAARMAEIERQAERERRYAEVLGPASELAAVWEFAAAASALEKVHFDEPELAERLAVWRSGVGRLVSLKARIIAAINEADPPLKKSDLMIRGAGGEVVGADEAGITAKLLTGKTESLAWRDVGPQAVEKLVEIAGGAQSADDWLGAGVLALASKDPTSAEKHFQHARSLGAEIGPYLAPLAATALAKAKGLLEAEEFGEAVSALEEIQKDYGEISWFTSHKTAFDAASEQAKAGLYQQKAEGLYAEAAELYAREELFDLRPLVQKLRKEYPDSAAVTDTERKPSFAELEKGIADLGQFITVRQDGKGDFASIQAALDAAPANSLVEIQDDGPYNEKLMVMREKPGLRIRGGKRYWPIVRSTDPQEPLVTVLAAQTAFERLILVYCTSGAGPNRYVLYTVPSGSSRLRCTLVATDGRLALDCDETAHLEGADCILLTGVGGQVMAFRNCLLLGGTDAASMRTELYGCTIAGQASVNENAVFTDCVVRAINNPMRAEFQIKNCDVFGQRPPTHHGAVNCFSAHPQFRDPANLDYRLMPTSPCIGKASDGGDLGCRYTPEMIEMIQKALELRARGIIKF